MSQFDSIFQHWAIMERCTLEARRVVFHALNAARELGSSEITLEHFVLGLMADDVKTSATFARLAEGREALRREIVAVVQGNNVPAPQLVPMSSAAAQAMVAARVEADCQGHARIQSGHLLLAILGATDDPVATLLHTHGLSADRIRAGLADGASDTDGA